MFRKAPEFLQFVHVSINFPACCFPGEPQCRQNSRLLVSVRHFPRRPEDAGNHAKIPILETGIADCNSTCPLCVPVQRCGWGVLSRNL